MEATLRVTPEELMELINRDMSALYHLLDAIDKSDALLSETKDAITSEESDSIISKTIIYLDETRQQIESMISYCRSLENYGEMPMEAVYASPDVKAIILPDDSILNSANADVAKEKDFDPDETLQFCEYCGEAAPMSAKVCKKCGREFAIWRPKKTVPVKSYPDLHKEPAKPDNRTVSPVPMRVVYAAPDVMAENRETSTSTDRTKK